MICGTVSVAYTITGPTTLGITCLTMMRPVPAPEATAASMNSRLRMLKVWPRTMRAMVSQPTAPIDKNNRYSLRPNITVKNMTKKISGKPLRISMMRIIR